MPLAENFENGSMLGSAPEDAELPNEHDLEVLKAIGGDEDARDLSFQGIRRKLGVHQETLSRSLHRLQRDGFVERLEHAYRISPKGLSTIFPGRQQRLGVPFQAEDQYSVSLLKARLPPDVGVSELIESLSYKWFGNLRWLGSAVTSESATLSWMTDDTGLKISVKIREDELSIEIFPTNANSVSDATRSAFELFDHVSKAIKGTFRRPVAGMASKAA